MKIFYVLLYILTLYPSTLFADTVIVKRVINIRTIELVNGKKVRLIGIKCSNKNLNRIEKRDIRALNEQSMEFIRTWLEGKKVKLKHDSNYKHNNNRDNHGRLWAYVYCKVPNEYISLRAAFNNKWVMFNALIINAGHAYVDRKHPFKYIGEFLQYEKDARIHHLGLWKIEKSKHHKEP